MALTRALVPAMKERRWGRVIHISSIMGFRVEGGPQRLLGDESGAIGLARANALELGAFGITVNCIAPGPFPDRLAAEPAFRSGAGRVEQSDRRRPLGQSRRVDRPGTVVGQRRWQLHHRAGAVVDGGFLSPVIVGRRKGHKEHKKRARMETTRFYRFFLCSLCPFAAQPNYNLRDTRLLDRTTEGHIPCARL